jgi:hypothetical protein
VDVVEPYLLKIGFLARHAGRAPHHQTRLRASRRASARFALTPQRSLLERSRRC